MKKYIWVWVVSGWMLGMVVGVGAQQTYRWTEIYGDGELPNRSSVNEADGTLVVTGTAGTPSTVRLLTIDSPAVTNQNYGISGRVGYEGIEGEAYLEMWNVFADGSRYFTRTLSDRGAMGKLIGSEPGREFVLPFNRSGASDPLVRLEVNLVLPGAGVVTLEEVTLQDMNLPSGWAISSGTWLTVALCAGIGVLLGAVATLRRRKGDTTEARKMKAMDV